MKLDSPIEDMKNPVHEMFQKMYVNASSKYYVLYAQYNHHTCLGPIFPAQLSTSLISNDHQPAVCCTTMSCTFTLNENL